jgi:hypothetical protein
MEENLHRDTPLKDGIERRVDRRHSAAPELALDFEFASEQRLQRVMEFVAARAHQLGGRPALGAKRRRWIERHAAMAAAPRKFRRRGAGYGQELGKDRERVTC